MVDDDPRIDPTDLRTARFPGSFRRYDAKAVEEFLESVAERITATNALVDDLRRELDSARAVRKVEPDAPSPFDRPDLSSVSEDELVRLVGEETAHVLSTARHAAADIRSKAEESAARVIREATAEATRLVEEAEARAAELTAEATGARDAAVAEAEQEAAAIRAEAASEAESVLAEARAEAAAESERATAAREEAEEEAAAVLEAARDEGRSMVNEAKEVRTRILEDLQRRRDLGRAQVERLAAGRDQILAAYASVRANVDEITAQLEDGFLEPSGDAALDEGFIGVVVTADAGHDESDESDESDDTAGTVDRVDEAPAGAVPVVEDDTDDEVAGEAGEETAGADDGETAGDADADAEASEDEPAGAVAAGAGEDGASGDGEEAPHAGDVDALFARIRSERAESVARAQKVLAGEDGAETEPSAVAEADGAGEADDAAGDEGAGDDVTDDADAAPAAESHVAPELLADADALATRESALGPIEKALAKALKRHLADEQNGVLDALRRTESTDPSELLPSFDDHVAGYAAMASFELRAAAESGAATIEPGTEVDVTDLAHRLGTTLVEPFRRRIERSSAEVDGDADALDERLRALYREWKVEHIGAATSDALLSAYAYGQHVAAPEGAGLRWRIDPSQGPCPDAEDNALAGSVPKGETFPTGDPCPQAHPGCHCLLEVDR